MGIETIPTEETTAKRFGQRLAQCFKSNPSSTAWFFIQQAYPDYGGLDDLEWSDVVDILDRIIAE